MWRSVLLWVTPKVKVVHNCTLYSTFCLVAPVFNCILFGPNSHICSHFRHLDTKPRPQESVQDKCVTLVEISKTEPRLSKHSTYLIRTWEYYTIVKLLSLCICCTTHRASFYTHERPRIRFTAWFNIRFTRVYKLFLRGMCHLPWSRRILRKIRYC